MAKTIAALASVLSLLGFSIFAHSACGDSKDPIAVVAAQHEAYNAHDLEAFAKCYSQDIVVTLLRDAGNKEWVGMSEFMKVYSWMKTVPKEYHSETLDKFVSGPMVVVHERLHDSPFKNVPTEAALAFEVRDGLITHVWQLPGK